MADYSYIAQPQQPDTFRTLGSMMNVAGQAQNLQRGAIGLQQERALLQPQIERGQAESERAQAEAKVSRETAAPRIEQVKAESKRAEIMQNLDQYKLTGAYAQGAREISNALIQDPDFIAGNGPAMITKLGAARQTMIDSGVPAPVAEANAAHLIALASAQPKAVRDYLANQIQMSVGAQGQAAQNLVPAGQQQQPGGAMGPSGVPSAVVKDRFGNVEQGAMPITGKPASGPLVYPPNESAATQPEVEGIRRTAQQSAAQAPAQHFNNRMILDLTPEAFTGTGGGKLANVMNTVGLGAFIPKSAEDIGPATAQLRHFIALQIEQNAASQGANTDAARTLAAQAVLPSDSPEKAIKAITKVNDAYVTGNELYSAGMDAAINNPANPNGIFAARQFRAAWAQNFDPRITLLENAQKAGDTETIDRILGPKGSPQRARIAAELRAKTLKLQSLSQGAM